MGMKCHVTIPEGRQCQANSCHMSANVVIYVKGSMRTVCTYCASKSLPAISFKTTKEQSIINYRS